MVNYCLGFYVKKYGFQIRNIDKVKDSEPLSI